MEVRGAHGVGMGVAAWWGGGFRFRAPGFGLGEVAARSAGLHLVPRTRGVDVDVDHMLLGVEQVEQKGRLVVVVLVALVRGRLGVGVGVRLRRRVRLVGAVLVALGGGERVGVVS